MNSVTCQLKADWLRLPLYRRKDENDAVWYGRQLDRLVEILVAERPGIAMFEQTDWFRGVPAKAGLNQRMMVASENRLVAKALGRLVGLAVGACRIAGVPMLTANVHEVKSAFTAGITSKHGNGNATKDDVYRIAMTRFPILAWNDGQKKMQSIADACAVLYYAVIKDDPMFHMKLNKLVPYKKVSEGGL